MTDDALHRLTLELKQISSCISHEILDPLQEARQALETPMPAIELACARAGLLKEYGYLLQNVEKVKEADLAAIAQAAKGRCEAVIEQTGGTVEIEELPTIQGKPKQLEQMLFHTLRNGLQYNQSDTPSVYLSYQLEEGAHLLHIDDNGIGIEAMYQPLVFGMFRTVPGELEVEGYGAGMAFAKAVAENHGGTIAYSPRNGSGTRFTISLPAV